MKQLLCSRRFLPFFIVQLLGALNDNVLKNILVILIAFRNIEVFGVPSTQMVALAGGIFIFPFFIFSGLAGQMADKWSKAKLIRVIKAAEVGIMVLVAIGFYRSQYEWLFGALFLMGVHSAFFGPIKYSILPENLLAGELVGANGLVEAGTFVAILLGSVGGGMIAGASGNVAFYAVVTLMVIAVIGFLSSLAIPMKSGANPSAELQWDLIRPSVTVMKVLSGNRAVLGTVYAISWFWMLGAMVLSVLPIYVQKQWRGSELNVTLFLAAFSIGVGMGSLVCEKIAKRCGYAPTVKGSVVGMSVALMAVGLLPPEGSWLSLIAFLAFSVFGGLFAVPLYTLIQKKSDPQLCSQVIAANNILNALFMVVGSLGLMGLIAAGLTPTQILFLLGVGNLWALLVIKNNSLRDI